MAHQKKNMHVNICYVVVVLYTAQKLLIMGYKLLCVIFTARLVSA